MHFRASSFSWPAVSSGGRRRRALDFGSCWLLLLFLPVALFAAVMPRSLVVVMIVVVVVVVLHLHLHLHFALCDIPLPLDIVAWTARRLPASGMANAPPLPPNDLT